ncbi:hypothetical protein SBA4_3150026 [Candidatus Sulfopaludibacter sp. SbA4]|nr:hypothetical protein SBA4_3150026 [Candidatus Sulfopaludibacter sp. SbA4]
MYVLYVARTLRVTGRGARPAGSAEIEARRYARAAGRKTKTHGVSRVVREPNHAQPWQRRKIGHPNRRTRLPAALSPQEFMTQSVHRDQGLGLCRQPLDFLT